MLHLATLPACRPPHPTQREPDSSSFGSSRSTASMKWGEVRFWEIYMTKPERQNLAKQKTGGLGQWFRIM
jgi:hypothetical protein